MIETLLVDYLQQRLQCSDDGKTLLIGLNGDAPVFAVAAGVRGEADHPRFLTFARYLIHQRFDCDGFALMLPALLDGVAVYVAQWRCGGDSSVVTILPDGSLQANDLMGDLIGDIGVPGPALPGLVRRDFDRLFDALEIPLPR